MRYTPLMNFSLEQGGVIIHRDIRDNWLVQIRVPETDRVGMPPLREVRKDYATTTLFTCRQGADLAKEEVVAVAELFGTAMRGAGVEITSQDALEATQARLSHPENAYILLAQIAGEDGSSCLVGVLEYMVRRVGVGEQGGILTAFRRVCAQNHLAGPNEGEWGAMLNYIYVHPDYLGRGVGAGLLASMRETYSPAYVFGWTRNGKAIRSVAKAFSAGEYNTFFGSVPMLPGQTGNMHSLLFIDAVREWNPEFDIRYSATVRTQEGWLWPSHSMLIPGREVDFPLVLPQRPNPRYPWLFPLMHLDQVVYLGEGSQPLATNARMHLFVSMRERSFPDWEKGQVGKISSVYLSVSDAILYQMRAWLMAEYGDGEWAGEQLRAAMSLYDGVRDEVSWEDSIAQNHYATEIRAGLARDAVEQYLFPQVGAPVAEPLNRLLTDFKTTTIDDFMLVWHWANLEYRMRKRVDKEGKELLRTVLNYCFFGLGWYECVPAGIPGILSVLEPFNP